MGKTTMIFEVTVMYFVRNSMKQPVKLFRVLMSETGKQKNICLFYKKG